MEQRRPAEPGAGRREPEEIGRPAKRRRAIVTGATGFIGTALCQELLTHGYEVTAVIRPGSSKRKKLEALQHTDCQRSVRTAGNRWQGAEELTSDFAAKAVEKKSGLQIRELPLDNLSLLTDEGRCADLFYHLAWNGSSGQEREQFEMQVSNVSYTAEAIRTAKRCGCRAFIGAGSQAEYGVVRGKAVEEQTVPKPFMMYGAAKLAAYQMGKLVAEQEGVAFIWPRIYSIYGPGENSGTLVSYLVETLKKGEVPQVTECENLWDFTYIGDCVRMLRMLGESLEAKGIYNLSAGEPRPLKEFVEEIRDMVNLGIEIGFGAKKADPERTFWLQPDVTKIRKICGMCRTHFRDGIQRKAQICQ